MIYGYRNYILSNSSISNSYVNIPNYGPYSKQYPSIVSNLNNGKLNGSRPNPAEFSIMDTGTGYSSAREAYKRVFHPIHPNIKKKTMTVGENIYLKKIANIGKSSLKQGLPNATFYSNKCYDKNVVATKIKRVRSSGCIPPKKCSSVYNHQFTPINSFTQSSYF